MRILVVEDNDVDFYLVERALGDQFALARALSLAAGIEMVAREKFDLMILDLTLEDSSGYETFAKAHAAVSHIPILVLSSLDDEALELHTVSNGAQDLVRKSRLMDYPLDRAVRYAIERQRAEDAVRKTEQQYRTLFDHLPVAAFVCDSEGLITYYNEKAVELWGRIPKLHDPAYRYSGSLKLYAADGTPIPHNQSAMARALIERTGFNGYESIIEQPNGQRRTVLAHAHPILDEDGQVRGAINVFVDISRQRQAEFELHESERFAKSIVNSLAAHIAILDHSGNILAVNAAWQRFAEENGMISSGYGVGDNYLKICERAFSNTGHRDRPGQTAISAPRGEVSNESEEVDWEGGELALAACDGIRAVLEGERKEFYLEYPCHSPTEERWYALRVNPLDGEGATRAVVSHENITSRRLAERLASEQLGLREAVAGMEQVLGVVGHELRTPLAALRAISEFLAINDAKDSAEADRFLREMSQEIDRMSDTVNNLLEAARLNSGRAKWNWSEIDLLAVIDEAIASVSPLVDASQVQISIPQIETISPILGDADGIRRLLVNLLGNATKFTKQGRIDVFARQYKDLKGSWIELVVKDTGCGIASELSARLGEAFALNSGVVGRNHVSGTGLGLAICKGIAAAHGGGLSIASVQGQGTTVTVRLRADLKAAACGDTVSFLTHDEVAA